MSGAPQGSVLGPLLFVLFTADIWNHLENKIVFYADDTTLYSKISTLSDRIKDVVSLERDLLIIQTWCSTWDI